MKEKQVAAIESKDSKPIEHNPADAPNDSIGTAAIGPDAKGSTRTLGDALGDQAGVKFITDEMHSIINTDLAEGQLKGDYHSVNKYHLDGTCEINAWETERCQLASCSDCEGPNTSSKDIGKANSSAVTRDTENSAIAKTAEKKTNYNNFENFENYPNSLINQEMDNDVTKLQKP